MHAHTRQDHPRNHAQKAVGESIEGEANTEKCQRSRGHSLQADLIENGGQEDEEKTAYLANGSDIAELRTLEVQQVFKEVGNYGVLGVHGKAERCGHHSDHDEAPTHGTSHKRANRHAELDSSFVHQTREVTE